jgi:ribosomal protein L12E/L44/L45/RPP1/RPP2
MITIERLRELAKEAGHEINSEIHKFIDFVEGKHAAPEKTVAELQAEQAARAPAPAASDSAEPAAPAAPPQEAPPVEQPTA